MKTSSFENFSKLKRVNFQHGVIFISARIVLNYKEFIAFRLSKESFRYLDLNSITNSNLKIILKSFLVFKECATLIRCSIQVDKLSIEKQIGFNVSHTKKLNSMHENLQSRKTDEPKSNSRNRSVFSKTSSVFLTF